MYASCGQNGPDTCFSHATELPTAGGAGSWTKGSRGWNYQESYCKIEVSSLIVFDAAGDWRMRTI